MDMSPSTADGSARAGQGSGAGGWVRDWGWFLGLALMSAVVDLVSKAVLFGRLGMPGENPPIVLVPGMLTLETNLNEGALFGMGQGMGMGFAALSCAAIAGILWMVSRSDTRADRLLLTALALITGGIIGNLWDRLGVPGLVWHAPPERIGAPVFAVRDWIHFTLEGVIDWPIFNLADSWLVVGAGLLIAATWRTAPVTIPAPSQDRPDQR